MNGQWVSMTGAGGGGGGGGVTDLTGYIKEPVDDGWMVYRKDVGWQAVTTDLIATNPDILFRDMQGRFKSKANVPDLKNQLEVNRWFLEQLEASGLPVYIQPSEPDRKLDGDLWFNNDEDVMQLFVWHVESDAWIPVAPPTTLEGRVSTGEATQQAIIAQIQESLAEQERIKSKITQLEGAVGDHSLIFTSDQQNPRTGQFNLKNEAYQLVNSISDAKYITLHQIDRNDRPIDLERIQVNDVLRMSDFAGFTAELRVTGIADASVFTFESLGGELDRLAEYPYDFLLLSSFDPAGLATIDYVDERDNAKLDKTGGTVTGNIAMSSKNITGLAEPTANAHAATKKYVDSKAYKMHSLWQYKNTTEAENLYDGQFTIRTESGGNPIMKIYLAGKDANGRRWYGWSNDESSFTHGLGAQICTITDHDGEVMKAGKLTEGTFNNAGNNYARLKCEYYKGNWALTPDKFYTINAAGLLPHIQYDISHENSPTSFVAPDSSDKVPEVQA
jgi:hypothetical protein